MPAEAGIQGVVWIRKSESTLRCQSCASTGMMMPRITELGPSPRPPGGVGNSAVMVVPAPGAVSTVSLPPAQ